ncbi:DNA recombination protein RmuC [Nocardioides sp. Kera G14]|uniref:DNA recombination protein RmuC n=1 Tax=Nocardioides sp. Kera G14 TaxID=2884264 RepID=UPI001D125C4B|nr:DNA recombination protein RmuC [Nocardioides sp. Kera G14]UDY25241.1 DNA recombination protein RmuC [Nocardioides sp. Kera G14]
MVFLYLLLGVVLGAALGAAVVTQRLRTQHAAELAAELAGAREQTEAVVREAVAKAGADAESRLAHMESMLHAEHGTLLAQLRQQEAEQRAETEAALAAAKARVASLEEALDEARRAQRDLAEQHRRQAAEREAAAGRESQVVKVIAPVAAQIEKMQHQLLTLETKTAKQQGELAEQIRATQAGVAESRRASTDLANVLRNNNAVRGAWGETQLRNLVESAGLLNRVDFELQHSMTADSGARRPDMVLNLPGGKQMAIDAKVPYNDFMDAQREGLAPEAREQHLRNHAAKVRGHVDTLAAKGYWTGLAVSPEFTVAFIPNDQILNAALDIDPSLLDHSFKQNVLLATPTNLYSMLKTIAFTWKQEALTEDALALFTLGQDLYRRITTMASHVEKLGRSLTTSVKDYNKFVGSLERQVLPAARKINAVDGASLIPAPPEIEEPVRALTAGDLTAELATQEADEVDLFADLARPEFPDGIDQVVDAELVEPDADAV